MQIFKGVVVANKMQKTAVIEIVRKIPHPFYGKLLKRGKRYKVDTSDFSVAVGDSVKIIGMRPASKEKRFKILEVIKKGAS